MATYNRLQNLSFFRNILIFAAILTKLSVASHNLHGFKGSAEYLKSSLEAHGGVWMIQEHWLSEKKIPSMQSIGAQFVARSGMEDALGSGILRGRPFGGVAIAWAPNINHLVHPLSNHRHKRVVAVEIDIGEQKLLCISIYMPFFDASKREDCILETIDALTMVESIVEENPLHDIIIGGDFNTELKDRSLLDVMWTDFMTKFDFVSCDSLKDNYSPSYTYFHNSLDHKKWNDHFIIRQKSTVENFSISNHTILDEGNNPSDHLPIKIDISLPISTSTQKTKATEKWPMLRWALCKRDQITTYQNELSKLISSIPLSNV